ncbi:MAG: hypothetical protein HY062_11225, partial [Bacteroidetes bacterium]|nr:hypothetical protein [Bacteroidota bacterium]
MKKDYSLIKTIQTGKIYRILSLTFLLAVTSLRLSAQYCTPSFVSGCTGNDVISSFTLKSIVNPSGCSSGGYGDYTSISAPTLYIGQTYPVTISTIYGTAAVAIW